MNRHFTKEDIYEVNKHMKKCPSSLIIREMQIKTTIRYHCASIKITVMKKIEIPSFDGDVEKSKLYYI